MQPIKGAEARCRPAKMYTGFARTHTTVNRQHVEMVKLITYFILLLENHSCQRQRRNKSKRDPENTNRLILDRKCQGQTSANRLAPGYVELYMIEKLRQKVLENNIGKSHLTHNNICYIYSVADRRAQVLLERNLQNYNTKLNTQLITQSA